MSVTDERYASLMETGKGALASLRCMVAALECDYDRLEELREERDNFEIENPSAPDETVSATDESAAAWANENPDDAEELAELEAAAGECESREDAETRIQEDALSLQFRSGWVSSREEMEPEEFELLLTTGGPAVRIIGEIRDGQAHHPVLQVQDWGTPWTDYCEEGVSGVLEAYCGCFCFEF